MPAGDVLHRHHRYHGVGLISLTTTVSVVQGHVTAGHGTPSSMQPSARPRTASANCHERRILRRTKFRQSNTATGCTNGRNVTVRLSQEDASTLVRIQVGETRGGRPV